MAALADSLALGVTLFDPSAVVVGGGLGRSGDLLFHPLREQLAERLTFQVMPEVLPAALGDEAGCLGAGLLAWDVLGERTDTNTGTGTGTGTGKTLPSVANARGPGEP